MKFIVLTLCIFLSLFYISFRISTILNFIVLKDFENEKSAYLNVILMAVLSLSWSFYLTFLNN